ncbi:MAG: HlyD family efflux transporter periplasmic adaptor subunit [Pirellulaceae bacterium]|nr:HlyD family efflux transporter periplasmic adaptor subunit [Pirellulaceae bacterium]
MSQSYSGNATVEQVKKEVRQTIEELREMTRSEIPFDRFCESLLNKIVPLTGAYGAIIWQFKGESGFASIFGNGPRYQTLSGDNEQHQGLLYEVARNQKGLSVRSEAVSDSPEAANMLLIAVPIMDRQNRIWGVLELLQRAEINGETQAGYMKFTTQLAALFARWQEQHDLRAASVSDEQWANRVGFVREIHRSIDLNECSYAIANETRRLLKADRVVVAVEYGGKYKVKAVSSQDRFDNRGNVVKKLSRVVNSSIKTDTPLWLTGNTDQLPPQLAGFVNEYLDESHSRTLAVLPLVLEPPKPKDELTRRTRRQGRKIGGLVIEYFDQEVDEAEVEGSLSLVKAESTVALENAMATNEVFLLPFWRSLGKIRDYVWTNYRKRTIAALAALAVLTLAMIFWPMAMRIKVDGVLQPETRRNLFAKMDMVVQTVHHDHNAFVKTGDLLLTLESEPLDQRLIELNGQVDTLDQQIESLRRQLNHLDRVPDGSGGQTALQMAAQLDQLNIERRGILELKRNIDKQRESLEIVSPIDGTVMNWDAKRKLEGLPVQFGQPLLTVADLEGRWQVELLIPQGRAGYIREAFEKSGGKEIPADFLLTTDPNTRHKGRLVKISDRAETNAKGLTEFRAIIEIDSTTLTMPQAGAGVIARVNCGNQSMGFVLFYQVLDFLRTRVFF